MPKWTQGFMIGAVLIIVILGGALSAVSFMMANATRPQPKSEDRPPPLVNVLELEPGQVQFSVESQGSVLPVTQTSLSAEVAGTVVELSSAFEPGDSFVAGEQLMRIDPTNYEVAVARAKAALDQRQIEYDGAKKLREQGYRAEAELLSAKAALESARADLVRAERDLERTRIIVPYDGLVRSRDAELGDYVAPGSPIGTVFATDRFEVRLPLPDNDLAFVNLPESGVNTAVEDLPEVTLRGSYRGREVTWAGRIVRTEGVVDERTRMVFSVASIDDPYLRTAESGNAQPLPAGTFVSAEIEGIVLDDVVSIPRTLIRGNDQVVFVDDESQLRLRNLEFLRTDATYAYVAADQLEELRVVLTVLEAPLNGMLVRVRNDDNVEAASTQAPASNAVATGP
ncbi:MAG: efflux RND transporter periplasmic adaptor subunit [Pseudomonadota bacterium]